ncbi:hypothetical protein N0B31_14855 [Salinirubellus salinus]|uniref:Uncharacterized protein n=1 Tax=Salinirubellus salinus TaxID=1364945 RepID=A0A9E7U3M5_9EURY|nr:hypothetical protein [Salinirubellus salinus]UWM53415.1 hypothetical protein N0B31_14855 [Salinirubellus salinus]
MAPSIWELFVSLFSRGEPEDDEAAPEDDERRFVPSPLDLSVRAGHGGTDGERLRELSKIDERVREIEEHHQDSPDRDA